MPATQVESMICKTPKAKPEVAPANIFPQPPDSQETGNQFGTPAIEKARELSPEGASAGGISFHDASTGGKSIAPEAVEDGSDLDELVTSAIRRAKRGRPSAFDDHTKGKLVALLALGLSIRQAASVLGVSHTTIANTLKADPALDEEITAARFQAQVQPLACVVRESRRSWKAATWLLKYLDGKIASREETPDELRQRRRRESDEAEARIEASRKASLERYRREARGEA